MQLEPTASTIHTEVFEWMKRVKKKKQLLFTKTMVQQEKKIHMKRIVTRIRTGATRLKELPIFTTATNVRSNNSNSTSCRSINISRTNIHFKRVHSKHSENQLTVKWEAKKNITIYFDGAWLQLGDIEN